MGPPRIILTYDPRWGYTPAGHTPFWASLDTVEYVAGLLEEVGCAVHPLKTDENFEASLQEIAGKSPQALVFWLNEFMPGPSGRDIFTVSLLEKWGLPHTGPDSKTLGAGLDKEATKKVFRQLGLLTPESYVVYPGDFSPIYRHRHWEGYVIVKPLLLSGPEVWLIVRRDRVTGEIQGFLRYAPQETPEAQLAGLSAARWPIEQSIENCKDEMEDEPICAAQPAGMVSPCGLDHNGPSLPGECATRLEGRRARIDHIPGPLFVAGCLAQAGLQ